MATRRLVGRTLVMIGSSRAMKILVVGVEECHVFGVPVRMKQLLHEVAPPRDLADCWAGLESYAVTNVLVCRRQSCAVFYVLMTTL
jgi:hypothetical protein